MIALNKTERKSLVIGLAAVLVFVLTRLFHQTMELYYDSSYYLLSHTLLELFSVFVSYTIFIHGWLTVTHTNSSQRLNLSLLFLTVGSFDLFHTLTYKGMPFFQSEQSITIATWFWIAGRLTESVGLGWILIKNKDGHLRKNEKTIKLTSTILSALVVIITILLFSRFLPVLVIEGSGVTNFKLCIEYFISLIHFITLVYIINHYVQTRDPSRVTISLGILFLLVGELIFTLYRSVFDFDNLLGHIYKAMGYFYLYRGIFFPQFKKIFEERERVETNLIEAEERLIEQERRVSSLIIQAQEDERKRVSRELHDGVGQSLYSILVSLRMLKQTGIDPTIVKQIENIEKLSSTSMDEVKTIAFQLRPSTLDDLGLFSAVRSHIQRFENTFGIDVELEIDGKKQRFNPDVEIALYRIFQEALNNAAKYAETEKITVRICNDEQQIVLLIIDEGIGFDIKEYNKVDQKKGIGLYSMHERASLVKGVVHIDSVKGLGTTIKVVIPL